VEVAGDQAKVTSIKAASGMTSAILARGQVWAVNAKFALRQTPATDPNPFTVEPVGPAP
jgi:hypothetical protein